MAYIGREPIVGNFQKCDAITVVNGQAAYTLQVSSTNVVPESANHMLVSLNGILQAPVTSFTVSGATLTFASNLATGDVIDFVILLGNVLDLGTPSDGTVTTAKLADDAVTAAKATGFGKIAQVITATDVTQRTTTSTSFVTGSNTLTVDITPSATSSKIFIVASSSGQNNTASAYAYYTLYRDSTNLGDSTDGMVVLQQEAGSNNVKFSVGMSYLDSPSSTSALTYAVYMRVGAGTGVLNSEGIKGSITVMEVLA